MKNTTDGNKRSKELVTAHAFKDVFSGPPDPEALLGVQDYNRMLKAVQEWAIGSGFTIERDESSGRFAGSFSLAWQGVTLFEQLDFAGVITVCSHMTSDWENRETKIA
jgi:hypothetical protein